MNLFKPFAFTLLLSSLSTGVVMADGGKSGIAGISFAGVGISSNQYLGLYLNLPVNSASTAATNCNLDVLVNGVVTNSTPYTLNSANPLVFINAGNGPAVTTPPAQPELFQVAVQQNTTAGANYCAGLAASLGVYDANSQDLELFVPQLPKFEIPKGPGSKNSFGETGGHGGHNNHN
jgi:hypothetical protein